jgi:hypothetical protein
MLFMMLFSAVLNVLILNFLMVVVVVIPPTMVVTIGDIKNPLFVCTQP